MVAIVRANGDLQAEWYQPQSQDHYLQIDENIEEPNLGDRDDEAGVGFIVAGMGETTGGVIDRFSMSSFQLNEGYNVNQIKVWFLLTGIADPDPPDLITDIFLGEWKGEKTFSTVQSSGWRNSWENFQNDLANWTVVTDGSTQISVLDEHLGFKKVVKFYDSDPSEDCRIRDLGFSDQLTGTVYFIVAVEESNDQRFMIALLQGTNHKVQVGFLSSGNFYYFDGANLIDSGISYQLNTFYILKITFDCSINEFSFYYWNGSSWSVICEEKNFRNAGTAIDGIEIVSPNDHTGTVYASAVDYSWKAGYYEDRILDYITWISQIWDNLSGSQTELDGLEIKIKADDSLPGNTGIIVDTFYAEVTSYMPPILVKNMRINVQLERS